jgi:hypothetical protein
MHVNPKLLTDLARLATRYEPKDWEQLAASLDDDVQRGRIRALLLDLAVVSRSRPPRAVGSGRGTVRVREALANIRADDPARADFLDGIWLKLRERELLPTIAAVRAFSEAVGSKRIHAARRDQAINELMERLVELPPETLEQRMRETIVDRKLGQEYEEWVRLILGRPEAAEGPPNRQDEHGDAVRSSKETPLPEFEQDE